MLAKSEWYINTCNDGKRLKPPTNPEENIIWKQLEKDQSAHLYLALKEGCSGELQIFFQVAYQKYCNTTSKLMDTHTPGVQVYNLSLPCPFLMTTMVKFKVLLTISSRPSVTLFTVTAATFLNSCCNTFLLCTYIQKQDTNLVYLMYLFSDRFYYSDNSSIKEEIIWSGSPTSE